MRKGSRKYGRIFLFKENGRISKKKLKIKKPFAKIFNSDVLIFDQNTHEESSFPVTVIKNCFYPKTGAWRRC